MLDISVMENGLGQWRAARADWSLGKVRSFFQHLAPNPNEVSMLCSAQS
jgi:hypothetical protein